MPELSPTQLEFRTAMANLSAAVSLVTTDGPEGPAGLTVSAICSVTDAPPTLLVCVNRASNSHDVLVGNGRMAVNILAPAHEELARHFAGAGGTPTRERFSTGVWDRDTWGVPVLEDAIASIVGRIVDHHERGSHSVVFLEVEHILNRDPSAALVYFGRRFHSLDANLLGAAS
jgi:flavin reductase (NADH)